MFCNKPQVNVLTALLLAHGVEDAVVCPGSRNAAIVHNLHEANLRLHPVTDERSAAFVAIGLWLRRRRPIVVCVTSGSALLNLIPGVAEAYYRHIPLVIVSADRPTSWIGQYDGQTIPQTGALVPYATTWQLPDISADSASGDDLWYANRLVNEALCACSCREGQPVHLNVPISEPLFCFTVAELPPQRVIRSWALHDAFRLPSEIASAIRHACHPWIVIGQYEEPPIPEVLQLKKMGWTVMAENISNHAHWSDECTVDADGKITVGGETVAENPDLILHFGGAFVGKDFKLWLRKQPIPILRIDASDALPDTFCHLTYKLCASPRIALPMVVRSLQHHDGGTEEICDEPQGELQGNTYTVEAVFLANSTAVRWGQAHRELLGCAPFTFCNRGTNGIEGCLSVAAGYSLQSAGKVLCLTGDLSFFYDANSLFNVRLDGQLRILVVNNHGGGIFHKLPGLCASPALGEYIAAQHPFSVRGIADAYQCQYISATSACLADDFCQLLDCLLQVSSSRPVILEVFLENETGAW